MFPNLLRTKNVHKYMSSDIETKQTHKQKLFNFILINDDELK